MWDRAEGEVISGSACPIIIFLDRSLEFVVTKMLLPGDSRLLTAEHMQKARVSPHSDLHQSETGVHSQSCDHLQFSFLMISAVALHGRSTCAQILCALQHPLSDL